MAESDPTLARYEGITKFMRQIAERLHEIATRLNLDGAAIRGATQRLYNQTGGDFSKVTDSMIESALRVVDVEMVRGAEAEYDNTDNSGKNKTVH